MPMMRRVAPLRRPRGSEPDRPLALGVRDARNRLELVQRSRRHGTRDADGQVSLVLARKHSVIK